MDYEMMVKEACEEIMGGIEKQAKKRDRDEKYIDDSAAYTGRKAGRGALKGAGIGAGSGAVAGGVPSAVASYGLSRGLGASPGKAALAALGGGVAGAIPGSISFGLSGAGLGAGIGAGYGAIHGGNVRQRRKQAEKAAAYYDEAQLVKQAAEADYAEACAYEEAALQILDELGYLD